MVIYTSFHIKEYYIFQILQLFVLLFIILHICFSYAWVNIVCECMFIMFSILCKQWMKKIKKTWNFRNTIPAQYHSVCDEILMGKKYRKNK